MTLLLFTEGKAFVELEIRRAARRARAPDFVTDVGQKQDEAIKSGLPG